MGNIPRSEVGGCARRDCAGKRHPRKHARTYTYTDGMIRLARPCRTSPICCSSASIAKMQMQAGAARSRCRRVHRHGIWTMDRHVDRTLHDISSSSTNEPVVDMPSTVFTTYPLHTNRSAAAGEPKPSSIEHRQPLKPPWASANSLQNSHDPS